MTDINHILKRTVRNMRYGAPMGKGFGSPRVGERCHLQQADLDSGGYDASGAYWGTRAVGQRLYCAFSTLNAPTGWQQYVDARDRVEAITKVTDIYGVAPFK